MVSYIKVCLRYWWIILIITIISTAGTAYLSIYHIAPKYSTSTTLYILKMNDRDAANNESVYQNLLASQMLVSDYKEMVKTDLIIERVRGDLEESFPGIKSESPDSFADSITVSNKPDTRLIDIKVTNGDPRAAAAIANKIAEVFKEQSLELLKTESVTIINTAGVPSAPVSPRPFQDSLLAFLAGLTGSVAVIMFLSYAAKVFRDDNMKKAEE
ncbi:MAG: hypothetical protein GX279_12435 [Clostridiaceae bacterium]|nr:hypothetical protein [Clostridiaceae bacterium]